MSMPEHRRTPGLTPEAASLLDTYFARVHGAMLVTAAGEAGETVAELKAHVLEELSRTDGSPAALTAILAELGPPEELAGEYADVPVRAAAAQDADDADREPQGTFLGMPYDLRFPTARRIASRWWDPTHPRVFVPRVFGLGWDINFGAVAVRLGIVRPDDEDEPFSTVPAPWMAAALALPVALTVAIAAVLAEAYPGWPALVPSHFGITGQADGAWAKAALAGWLLVLSVLPALGAASTFVRRRPALNRVAACAAATLMAVVAMGQLVQTTLSLDGMRGVWPIWIGIVAAIALPFVLLTVLSRVGRSHEQRRDLDESDKKERV